MFPKLGYPEDERREDDVVTFYTVIYIAIILDILEDVGRKMAKLTMHTAAMLQSILFQRKRHFNVQYYISYLEKEYKY